MANIDLLSFLQNRMVMTNIYQPVVIKELLLHGGVRTKAELASALAGHDLAVQKDYERIMMRHPKATLTSHGIIDYERRGMMFRLLPYPEAPKRRLEAIRVCEEKIGAWLEQKKSRERATESTASLRYEVLKDARGKCQLCGMSSDIKPIDIDHIIPKSKADKNGKVKLHGKLMEVNDRGNLQALCEACNRGKPDSDQTDFRKKDKLVRDKIPELIRTEGRIPKVKPLVGTALRNTLYDKLSEEHAELLAASDIESIKKELADIIEVIVALANTYEATESDLMKLVRRKRRERGGFTKAYYYSGDQ